MANLLKVGALFKSYKDFETALDDYCKEKSVLFRKVSSISVQKANAALSPADTAYDERLVYKNLTLRCKSGNHVRESQSKGVRPNQWTLNIQCPGQISLCAQTVPQALRVSKLIDIHNHATTKDFAKFYPENRRLKKDADIAQVKGMVLCRGQPIHIRDHVTTNLSVCMTTKDLANFRQKLMSSQRKANNDEEDVIKEMNSLLETDPGAVVGIVTAEPTASSADADSTQVAPLLNILFFQTSSMRDLFLKFGEILGIDTTYNTNRHNMHLIVFVVYDNHKNGRVVAFCFVRRETIDIVECAISNFVEANPEAVAKVQTVLVDKDLKEVSCVNKLIPHAHVHLCNVHVLRIFERETKKKCPGNSQKVMSILKKISKSGSSIEFEDTYQELQKEATPEFMEYFDRNWKDCESAWVLHVRNEALTLGVDSTNFVETQNGKIKRVLNRCLTLGDAVRGLLLLHRNRECESGYKDFREQAAVAYIANDKDPDIKCILSSLSSWGAKLLISELRLSRTLPDVDVDDVIEQGETCSCQFDKMFSMKHCQHVFLQRRMAGEPLLKLDDVPSRWLKGVNESASTVPLSMQSHINQTPAPPKPKTKDQRYRDCLKLCTEISDLVSQTGGRQNLMRTRVLEDVIRNWLSGKEVIVLPMNSDGSVVVDPDNMGNSVMTGSDGGASLEQIHSPSTESTTLAEEECSPASTHPPEQEGCQEETSDIVCALCKGPALRRVSLKEGGNFMRYYWICAARCRAQGGFFRWLKCTQCGSNNVREGHFHSNQSTEIVHQSQNSYQHISQTSSVHSVSLFSEDRDSAEDPESSGDNQISEASESGESPGLPFKLPQREPTGAGSKKKTLGEGKCEERRERAQSIPNDHVSSTAPGVWAVKSQTQSSLKYAVVLKADVCSLSLCSSIEPPCPHLYYCTCEDFKRWKGPCKHVFKVHLIRGESTSVAPQRMSVLTENGFTLPVHKVHGHPRAQKTNFKSLGPKQSICGVCKLRVQGVSSVCIVCKLKMHSGTKCSLPDPSLCRDGKADESVRVCRNCICLTCRFPKLPSHSCLCVVCRSDSADAQCINCMGAAHINCIYVEINWCFVCVQNSENVVSVEVRDLLLSDEMLTDTVIFKAQELLKKQFPHVMGLAHPIASEGTLSIWSKDEPHKSYAPSSMSAAYIQIINTGYDHWITCYKKKGIDNEIYILNSSGSTDIGSFTEQQLALILKTTASSFKVAYYGVKLQDGTNECGPLAIAFATELAFVGQHMYVDFITEELRPHLLKCLLAGKLEPFPRKGRSWASQRMCFENVSVHCTCRLPEHFDERVTKCCQCRTLCHWKCHGLSQEPTARRWLCSKCTTTKMR